MFRLFHRQDLNTAFYSIESEKVPIAFHKVRIAVLTDLHGHSFGKDNEWLIREVSGQNPDYVMLVGDMVVWHLKNIETSYRLISQLANRFPVIYTSGNHERKAAALEKTKERYRRYQRTLREKGVVFLNNQSIHLVRDGSRIRVSGLDIGKGYYKKVWQDVRMPVSYPERLLGPADKEGFQILLAHHPDYFPVYAKWGADLTLSGHIHGGIAIFPVFGGLISPSLELFPKYDFGLFEKNGAKMVLSKGLGSHTIPIRIRNRPELVMVELRTLKV